MAELILKKSLLYRVPYYGGLISVFIILLISIKVGILPRIILYTLLALDIVWLITIICIDSKRPIVIIHDKIIKFNFGVIRNKYKIIEIDQILKIKWYMKKVPGNYPGKLTIKIDLKNGDIIEDNWDFISKFQRKKMFFYLKNKGVDIDEYKPKGYIEVF